MGSGVSKLVTSEMLPKGFADMSEQQRRDLSDQFDALIAKGLTAEKVIAKLKHEAELSIHHPSHQHQHHGQHHHNKHHHHQDREFAGDSFEKRGVTYHLFERVRDLALAMNNDPAYWTIGRISAYIVGNHEIVEPNCRFVPLPDKEKTLTYSARNSLVEVLRLHHHSADIPHEHLGVFYGQVVGYKADIFVSFAYSSNFIELVDGLDCFLENTPSLNRDTTCFWFDLFVNNQWEALAHDFVWWATTFRTAVQDIGHTLCFLTPWARPDMLTRAWCLYEISCSHHLSITMSRSQIENFRSTLTNPSTKSQVEAALCKIDLQNSQAYLAADRDRIFEVVKSSEKGFIGYNTEIMALIRQWIVNTTTQLSSRILRSSQTLTLKDVDDLVSFAGEFKASGEFDKAKEGYERALDALEQLGVEPSSSANTLDIFNECADVLAELGETDKSLDMYKKAMEGYSKLFGSHDLRTINAQQNIGSTYFDIGEFSEANKYFEQAIKSYEEHKFTSLPAYYTALTNLANVQTKMKHFDSARALFEKALHKQMHDVDIGDRHPDTIRTAFDYGEMLFIKKDYRHAVQYFDQALKGCQLTGIEDNPMINDARKRIQACIDFGHIVDF